MVAAPPPPPHTPPAPFPPEARPRPPRNTARLGLDVYFATPYHAWERGLNENTNGLVRQFFPKGLDLAGVTHRQVRRVEDLLNTRPRKTLGYRTPDEVLAELSGP